MTHNTDNKPIGHLLLKTVLSSLASEKTLQDQLLYWTGLAPNC